MVSINYSSVNIFVTWRRICHFLPTKFLPTRYWFSYALHHNDSKNMNMKKRIKKANCVFEVLCNLYLIILLIEPRWRNYLFELKISWNTTPQTCKLHQIMHQQVQHCYWYFGLTVISALLLIVCINATLNLSKNFI